MTENFGDVGKFEFAANFSKWPLAVYLENHSTFWRLTDITTTRDEVINLESGKNEPVGHIQKIDFDFEESCIFENFELTISCLISLRQLK